MIVTFAYASLIKYCLSTVSKYCNFLGKLNRLERTLMREILNNKNKGTINFLYTKEINKFLCEILGSETINYGIRFFSSTRYWQGANTPKLLSDVPRNILISLVYKKIHLGYSFSASKFWLYFDDR